MPFKIVLSCGTFYCWLIFKLIGLSRQIGVVGELTLRLCSEVVRSLGFDKNAFGQAEGGLGQNDGQASDGQAADGPGWAASDSEDEHAPFQEVR